LVYSNSVSLNANELTVSEGIVIIGSSKISATSIQLNQDAETGKEQKKRIKKNKKE
jgi:hypothetical protein